MYIEIFWHARQNAILWGPRGESCIVPVIKKLKISQRETHVQENEDKSARGIIIKVYLEHSGDRNNE